MWQRQWSLLGLGGRLEWLWNRLVCQSYWWTSAHYHVKQKHPQTHTSCMKPGHPGEHPINDQLVCWDVHLLPRCWMGTDPQPHHHSAFPWAKSYTGGFSSLPGDTRLSPQAANFACREAFLESKANVNQQITAIHQQHPGGNDNSWLIDAGWCCLVHISHPNNMLADGVKHQPPGFPCVYGSFQSLQAWRYLNTATSEGCHWAQNNLMAGY